MGKLVIGLWGLNVNMLLRVLIRLSWLFHMGGFMLLIIIGVRWAIRALVLGVLVIILMALLK